MAPWACVGGAAGGPRGGAVQRTKDWDRIIPRPGAGATTREAWFPVGRTMTRDPMKQPHRQRKT
ncbi:hypothetical protein COI42_28155, partial [Priestia aryabhattai]